MRYTIEGLSQTDRLMPCALSFFPALALYTVLGSGLFLHEAGLYNPAAAALAVQTDALASEAATGEEAEGEDFPEKPRFSLTGEAPSLAAPGEAAPDLILEGWRNTGMRDQVEVYFSALTGDKKTAGIILANASRFDIPPGLAFALCWEESRFKANAVNTANPNQTIDRGLFQLNSASFHTLTEAEFFDPAVNAYHALAHLRWCLDAAGSEVSALAMYNAGQMKVKGDNTPKRTLDYTSRIIKNQRKIEERFRSDYQELPAPAQEALAEAEAPPDPSGPAAAALIEPSFTLALLSPLGAGPASQVLPRK